MAATVTIRLIEISGANLSTPVSIRPKSTPLVVGDTLAIGKLVAKFTATDGTATVSLMAGDYEARICDERFDFTVPASTGSYELSALVT